MDLAAGFKLPRYYDFAKKRVWDPTKHPRWPAGTPVVAGRFMKKADIAGALKGEMGTEAKAAAAAAVKANPDLKPSAAEMAPEAAPATLADRSQPWYDPAAPTAKPHGEALGEALGVTLYSEPGAKGNSGVVVDSAAGEMGFYDPATVPTGVTAQKVAYEVSDEPDFTVRGIYNADTEHLILSGKFDGMPSSAIKQLAEKFPPSTKLTYKSSDKGTLGDYAASSGLDLWGAGEGPDGLPPAPEEGLNAAPEPGKLNKFVLAKQGALFWTDPGLDHSGVVNGHPPVAAAWDAGDGLAFGFYDASDGQTWVFGEEDEMPQAIEDALTDAVPDSTVLHWNEFEGNEWLDKQFKAGLAGADGVDMWPDSLDELTFVKNLGGSTGARLFEDAATGRRYVVKKGASPEHLRSEFAADQAYRAAGINVPEARIYPGPNGEPTKVAEFIDGTDMNKLPQGQKNFVKQELRKGFVVDALLANWDVVGLSEDNVKLGADGKVYRIDNGGALFFKAMGGKKPAGSFGKEVKELASMRNKQKTSGKVFGTLTDAEVAQQVEGIFSKISPLQFASAAGKHMADEDQKVGARLAARVKWVQNWAAEHGAYKGGVPGGLPTGAPEPQAPAWTPESPNVAPTGAASTDVPGGFPVGSALAPLGNPAPGQIVHADPDPTAANRVVVTPAGKQVYWAPGPGSATPSNVARALTSYAEGKNAAKGTYDPKTGTLDLKGPADFDTTKVSVFGLPGFKQARLNGKMFADSQPGGMGNAPDAAPNPPAPSAPPDPTTGATAIYTHNNGLKAYDAPTSSTQEHRVVVGANTGELVFSDPNAALHFGQLKFALPEDDTDEEDGGVFEGYFDPVKGDLKLQGAGGPLALEHLVEGLLDGGHGVKSVFFDGDPVGGEAFLNDGGGAAAGPDPSPNDAPGGDAAKVVGTVQGTTIFDKLPPYPPASGKWGALVTADNKTFVWDGGVGSTAMFVEMELAPESYKGDGSGVPIKVNHVPGEPSVTNLAYNLVEPSQEQLATLAKLLPDAKTFFDGGDQHDLDDYRRDPDGGSEASGADAQASGYKDAGEGIPDAGSTQYAVNGKLIDVHNKALDGVQDQAFFINGEQTAVGFYDLDQAGMGLGPEKVGEVVMPPQPVGFMYGGFSNLPYPSLDVAGPVGEFDQGTAVLLLQKGVPANTSVSYNDEPLGSLEVIADAGLPSASAGTDGLFGELLWAGPGGKSAWSMPTSETEPHRVVIGTTTGTPAFSEADPAKALFFDKLALGLPIDDMDLIDAGEQAYVSGFFHPAEGKMALQVDDESPELLDALAETLAGLGYVKQLQVNGNAWPMPGGDAPGAAGGSGPFIDQPEVQWEVPGGATYYAGPLPSDLQTVVIKPALSPASSYKAAYWPSSGGGKLSTALAVVGSSDGSEVLSGTFDPETNTLALKGASFGSGYAEHYATAKDVGADHGGITKVTLNGTTVYEDTGDAGGGPAVVATVGDLQIYDAAPDPLKRARFVVLPDGKVGAWDPDDPAAADVMGVQVAKELGNGKSGFARGSYDPDKGTVSVLSSDAVPDSVVVGVANSGKFPEADSLLYKGEELDISVDADDADDAGGPGGGPTGGVTLPASHPNVGDVVELPNPFDVPTQSKPLPFAEADNMVFVGYGVAAFSDGAEGGWDIEDDYSEMAALLGPYGAPGAPPQVAVGEFDVETGVFKLDSLEDEPTPETLAALDASTNGFAKELQWTVYGETKTYPLGGNAAVADPPAAAPAPGPAPAAPAPDPTPEPVVLNGKGFPEGTSLGVLGKPALGQETWGAPGPNKLNRFVWDPTGNQGHYWDGSPGKGGETPSNVARAILGYKEGKLAPKGVYNPATGTYQIKGPDDVGALDLAASIFASNPAALRVSYNGEMVEKADVAPKAPPMPPLEHTSATINQKLGNPAPGVSTYTVPKAGEQNRVVITPEGDAHFYTDFQHTPSNVSRAIMGYKNGKLAAKGTYNPDTGVATITAPAGYDTPSPDQLALRFPGASAVIWNNETIDLPAWGDAAGGGSASSGGPSAGGGTASAPDPDLPPPPKPYPGKGADPDFPVNSAVGTITKPGPLQDHVIYSRPAASKPSRVAIAPNGAAYFFTDKTPSLTPKAIQEAFGFEKMPPVGVYDPATKTFTFAAGVGDPPKKMKGNLKAVAPEATSVKIGNAAPVQLVPNKGKQVGSELTFGIVPGHPPGTQAKKVTQGPASGTQLWNNPDPAGTNAVVLAQGKTLFYTEGPDGSGAPNYNEVTAGIPLGGGPNVGGYYDPGKAIFHLTGPEAKPNSETWDKIREALLNSEAPMNGIVYNGKGRELFEAGAYGKWKPNPKWDSQGHQARQTSLIAAYKPQQKKVLAQEKAGIQAYQNSSYGSMNGYLRGKTVDSYGSGGSKTLKKKIDDTQKGLMKGAAPYDMVVDHAMGSNSWKNAINAAGGIKAMKGKVLAERGFSSCSIKYGTWHGSVRAYIRIPKGFPGQYLNAFSGSVHPGEYEQLLPYGIRMRVVDAYMEGSTMRLIVEPVGFAAVPGEISPQSK